VTTRQLRIARDDGAELAEWGAALLVIATLVAVLAGPVLPQSVKDYAEYAICRVTNFGSPAACETPPDKTYKPDKCITALRINGYGASVDIAFFSVGKDLTFMQTTDNNGKVTVVAVNGTSLGVGAEAGAGVNWGNAVNFGAKVDAKAGLKLGEGDSWIFDSQEEADDFIGEIQKRAIRDGIEDLGPLGWVGSKVANAVDPPEVPEPDISRYEIELKGSAGANVGVKLGPRKTSGGKNPSVSPNLGVGVGIDAAAKGVVEKNNKDGSTSVTVQVTGGAQANGQYVIGGRVIRAEAQGKIKVSYDKNGTLNKLELTRAVTVGDEATWTTTEVPINSDADRRAVYAQFGRDLATGSPLATPLQLTWDDFAPTEQPDAGASPLQQLIYEEGKTSKVTYDNQQTNSSYGAKVALGLKLGANVNINGKEMEVSDAQYLGAPEADGSRDYQTFEECGS